MSTPGNLFDAEPEGRGGLDASREIAERALAEIKPCAVVLAFSGGQDSQTAYYVARELGIRVDFLLHVNTRTGIRETTEFVRRFAAREGVPYVEADAGDAYETYVRNHGFFGRGRKAHTYAYHLLKADHIRRAVSSLVRRGRKGVPVIILSGARIQESDNRSQNFSDRPVDKDKSNYYVKLLHYWSKRQCLDFLSGCGAERNPVTENLCRSGECLCGTMQGPGVRAEASFFYPEWGRWLDRLEREVKKRFPWGWGQDVPRGYGSVARAEKYGQRRFEDFQPLCSSCLAPPREEPPVIKVLK